MEPDLNDGVILNIAPLWELVPWGEAKKYWEELLVGKYERIILFGSTARGEMGPHSDLDVLVVMPDGTHRRRTAQEIYRHLWGFGFAKDIVVVTESDIREYGSNPYLIIKNALEEGKDLYHAAG